MSRTALLSSDTSRLSSMNRMALSVCSMVSCRTSSKVGAQSSRMIFVTLFMSPLGMSLLATIRRSSRIRDRYPSPVRSISSGVSVNPLILSSFASFSSPSLKSSVALSMIPTSHSLCAPISSTHLSQLASSFSLTSDAILPFETDLTDERKSGNASTPSSAPSAHGRTTRAPLNRSLN